MFIMIDGIDGSGKSTVIQTWKDFLIQENYKTFDLKKYWLDNKSFPDLKEVISADFIFSCEPTYAPMGKIIREELINNKNEYDTTSLAHAYSLDRLILYKKIIIPLLNRNKNIIQDRGISTTLSYQSAQNDSLSFDEIATLPGNQTALKHAPDHLVIMDIKPENAIQRLTGRREKKDNSIFEKLSFLKKFNQQFRNNDYKKIFEKQKTKIHYLSTEKKIDIMKKEVVNFLKTIIC